MLKTVARSIQQGDGGGVCAQQPHGTEFSEQLGRQDSSTDCLDDSPERLKQPLDF